MFSLSFTNDGGPINTVFGIDLPAIVMAFVESQSLTMDTDAYYGHFRVTTDGSTLSFQGFGKAMDLENQVWGYYDMDSDNVRQIFIPMPIADFVENPRTIEFVPSPLPTGDDGTRDLFYVGLSLSRVAHSCGYISFYNV